MKLIIIINHNPFTEGSASANRWLSLIEGLVLLGVEIKMLVYGAYQSLYEHNNWPIEGNIYGINYKYILPMFITGYFKKRYNEYIGFHLRKHTISKLILKEIAENDGVIWTDSSQFGFLIAEKIKTKMPNKVLFLEMSEFMDLHKYNKVNFVQRWKSIYRQTYFERKAFKEYNGLALMTKTLYCHYKSFPKQGPKLLHLPMTVDLDRFIANPLPPEGFAQPFIAFVGSMNDAKDGISILIKSFNAISKYFPDYKLYLIGSWDYDSPMHLSLIKEYKLEEIVFWRGVYQRDQIPSIIKNADLLVLPRPDSKQAQGGFPTKLGEYLATSKPVCATKVGEIPYYLKDGESVFFAEPGSVDSFAEAMRRALSNPQEAKRVGINGRKVAETHFSKDIQAKVLYDFLYSLIKDKS